jgi:hypothetical protein
LQLIQQLIQFCEVISYKPKPQAWQVAVAVAQCSVQRVCEPTDSRLLQHGYGTKKLNAICVAQCSVQHVNGPTDSRMLQHGYGKKNSMQYVTVAQLNAAQGCGTVLCAMCTTLHDIGMCHSSV